MICIDCVVAETGSNRRKRCTTCGETHEAEKIKETNRKHSIKRAAERKANPRKCVNDDKDTEHPRVKYCKECRIAAAQAREESRTKRVAVARIGTEERRKRQREAEDEILIKPAKPWKRKPKPAPIMTNEEQKRHDEELEKRLSEECGYNRSDPRSLSKEEIAVLLPTLIREPQRQSYAGYCDRMMTEGWS